MTETQFKFAIVAIILLNIAISYGAATIGEPRSLWLWRDILGVL